MNVSKTSKLSARKDRGQAFDSRLMFLGVTTTDLRLATRLTLSGAVTLKAKRPIPGNRDRKCRNTAYEQSGLGRFLLGCLTQNLKPVQIAEDASRVDV